VAFPALADYLGPDRTRTESYVETYDWGVWAKPDPTGNSCQHTYGTDCIVCTWERTPGSPCGDATYWYKVGTRSEVVERTVTYPEATISGALNGCTLCNGWCSTMPVLSLTASEPVSGYAITLIEGARNGEAFACNGASCDVPLLEGENNFTFWALSSWGDSSQMGSLSARVDTVPPQIEGTLSGTPGEAGWYVSPVTLSASASDPQPGSGIETFTYTWNASPAQPYTGPITVADGVHTLTFRAQDLAGHVSEISQRVQVDTLPPQVNASLAGEQANGWYLSQVTFTAAASDDGSGLARIEYALDGASWQAYTAPVTVGDGIHMLRVRALDVAGNQAEMAPLSFQVDGRSPQIRLTPSWYLWERGEVQVRDGESGLVGVEVEIRDPQGRWPKVVRSYEASGGSFATGIEWDRHFADGVLAPIGSYEVVVKAWDRAGNFARQTASLHIPAPNAPTYTPAPAPTVLPVMVEVSSPTPVPLQLAMETAIPTPTVLVSGFQTFATPPVESQSRTSPTGSGQSPVLWGMAALGAIGVATAYALERRRKRREEEAQQREEAAAEASRRNAAEAARRVQNWLQGQAMLQNALNNPALSDAEKRTVQQQDQTKGIGAALGTLAGLVQAAQERYRTMRERMNRLEDSIKSHYQKPFNQTPISAVIIPPLTSEQYVALSNWNVAAQVATYGITAGVSAGIGAVIGFLVGGPSGAFAGGVIGAIIGATWGTYEVSCLTAVQDQFEQAYNRKESVEVWREGRWSFAVHGAGSSYYAVANGPLSATYVAATTFLMTGKIP